MLALRTEQFWEFVRERERIRSLKESDSPGPWTRDKRLQRYWFPNVWREDDRTTKWLRAMVCSVPREDDHSLLMAIVAFRMFNKIETGELLLPMLTSTGYSREELLTTLGPLKQSPWNQRMPLGMLPRGDLGQVERVLTRFQSMLDQHVAMVARYDMEQTHWGLENAGGIPPSLAYEIAYDLRHIGAVDGPDVWAYPTQMVCEAVGRLLGNIEVRHTRTADRFLAISIMRELVAESQYHGWMMSESHRALSLYNLWAREAKPVRRYHLWTS